MFALDVLLLCMIIVCIIYCWILNQRIRELHNSRIEFARMIKEFDAAVIKANHSIDDLSSLGKTANDQIKKSTKAAEVVIEELTEVYEIGDKTCANLEAAISEARKCQKIMESTKKDRVNISRTKEELDTEEEEDTMLLEEEACSENEAYGNRYIEDSEIPEHKNLIEKVLDKITTQKGAATTFDQNEYYSSLRKLSMRK